MNPLKRRAAILAALSLCLAIGSASILALGLEIPALGNAHDVIAGETTAGASDGTSLSESGSSYKHAEAANDNNAERESGDSSNGSSATVAGDTPAEASENEGSASNDRSPSSSEESARSSKAPSTGTEPSPARPDSPSNEDRETQPGPALDQVVRIKVSVDSSRVGSPVSKSISATLDKGATAFDALQACGLPVDAVSGQFGVYVRSIGGLAERDHGPSSGWTYAVNGQRPAAACSSYQIADGDTIEWIYVV